jgi:hypothetical protein
LKPLRKLYLNIGSIKVCFPETHEKEREKEKEKVKEVIL